MLEWGAETIAEDEDEKHDDALEAAVEAGHQELVEILCTSSHCLTEEMLDNAIRCVIGQAKKFFFQL